MEDAQRATQEGSGVHVAEQRLDVHQRGDDRPVSKRVLTRTAW